MTSVKTSPLTKIHVQKHLKRVEDETKVNFSKVSTKGWDDETTDDLLVRMVKETIARVKQDDPAKGEWCVHTAELPQTNIPYLRSR